MSSELSMSTTSSSLSRKLDGGLQLPSLSPLVDPKRHPTPSVGTEVLADGLTRHGFEVGWNNGQLQVSPTASTLGQTCTFEDMLRSIADTCHPAGPRARAPTFLTFRQQGLRRPYSSPQQDLSPRPMSSQPQGRFTRVPRSPLVQALTPPGCDSGRPSSSTPSLSLDPPDSPTSRPMTPSTQSPMASPGGTRRTGHPMQMWKPSKGHKLIVFNDMDKDKNGKVTRSEFELMTLALGYSTDQCNRLFSRLDKRGRGYIEAADWGTRDLAQVLEAWTLRYMQHFMGLPGVTSTPDQVAQYFRRQEQQRVKNLLAAVNLVRVNAVTRGSHSSSRSGNAIYDTFRFMDTDGSGDLSKEEVRDAFFALGVYLSDPVVDQILSVFDKDGDGTICYHEFVSTMFPNAQKHS